jgi:hypothetical protein
VVFLLGSRESGLVFVGFDLSFHFVFFTVYSLPESAHNARTIASYISIT